MISTQREQYIPYSAAKMYALVSDVESYPSFLPWCNSARIIDSCEDYVTAECTMHFIGHNLCFVTKNHFVPDRSIAMSLVSGPFNMLNGIWSFVATEDNICHVSLLMECELEGRILRHIVEPLLLRQVQKLVDVFKQRAHEVYSHAGK